MFHHFWMIPSTFHRTKSKNLTAFFSRQQPQQQSLPREICGSEKSRDQIRNVRKGKPVVSLLEFLLLQLLGIVNATHFWHQAISTLHAIQRPSSSSTQQRERLDLEGAMKHGITRVSKLCIYIHRFASEFSDDLQTWALWDPGVIKMMDHWKTLRWLES